MKVEPPPPALSLEAHSGMHIHDLNLMTMLNLEHESYRFIPMSTFISMIPIHSIKYWNLGHVLIQYSKTIENIQQNVNNISIKDIIILM